MSRNTKNPSLLLVALHVILTLVTGGTWLLALVIYYGLKYMNNR